MGRSAGSKETGSEVSRSECERELERCARGAKGKGRLRSKSEDMDTKSQGQGGETVDEEISRPAQLLGVVIVPVHSLLNPQSVASQLKKLVPFKKCMSAATFQ